MSPVRSEFTRRLLGVTVAGGLLAAAGAVAAGFLLEAVGRAGLAPTAHESFRRFLGRGGWLWLPLWGAALGSWRALAWARLRSQRALALGLALGLTTLPLLVRPEPFEPGGSENPRTARAKARAILRWSYRSPGTVAGIVRLSRDPDPRVREPAVLALGVNLIVDDIERAAHARPSRYARHPLRDSLRLRLLEALVDPVESVRAEAARALWNSPVAFGLHPAAAETLAAVLDRATRPGVPERLAWLALDAAAGTEDPALRSAAARFAAATADSGLARAARRAAAAGR